MTPRMQSIAGQLAQCPVVCRHANPAGNAFMLAREARCRSIGAATRIAQHSRSYSVEAAGPADLKTAFKYCSDLVR